MEKIVKDVEDNKIDASDVSTMAETFFDLPSE